MGVEMTHGEFVHALIPKIREMDGVKKIRLKYSAGTKPEHDIWYLDIDIQDNKGYESKKMFSITPFVDMKVFKEAVLII